MTPQVVSSPDICNARIFVPIGKASDDRALLVFERKPNRERHLPVGDLVLIHDTAGFGYAEPVHIA